MINILGLSCEVRFVECRLGMTEGSREGRLFELERDRSPTRSQRSRKVEEKLQRGFQIRRSQKRRAGWRMNIKAGVASTACEQRTGSTGHLRPPR